MLTLPHDLLDQQHPHAASEDVTLVESCVYAACYEDECLTAEHQIILVREGALELWSADGYYRVASGQAVLLPRGLRLRFRKTADAGRLRYASVLYFFRGGLLRAVGTDAGGRPSTTDLPSRGPLVLSDARFSVLAEAAGVWLGMPAGTRDAALLNAKAGELLRFVMRVYPSALGAFLADLDAGAPDLDGLVARFGESRRRLTVAELARLSNRSLSTFKRDFSARFGEPPGRYLRRLRLERARERLRAGARPGEVAAELGFSDAAHFTRSFKRAFGVVPSEAA